MPTTIPVPRSPIGRSPRPAVLLLPLLVLAVTLSGPAASADVPGVPTSGIRSLPDVLEVGVPATISGGAVNGESGGVVALQRRVGGSELSEDLLFQRTEVEISSLKVLGARCLSA